MQRVDVAPSNRLYGEGLNPLQSPAVSSQWLQDLANEYVWGRQMNELIKQAQATCGCRQ
jgi:hypothetical protein